VCRKETERVGGENRPPLLSRLPSSLPSAQAFNFSADVAELTTTLPSFPFLSLTHPLSPPSPPPQTFIYHKSLRSPLDFSADVAELLGRVDPLPLPLPLPVHKPPLPLPLPLPLPMPMPANGISIRQLEAAGPSARVEGTKVGGVGGVGGGGVRGRCGWRGSAREV
jgi:hypothetical protein